MPQSLRRTFLAKFALSVPLNVAHGTQARRAEASQLCDRLTAVKDVNIRQVARNLATGLSSDALLVVRRPDRQAILFLHTDQNQQVGASSCVEIRLYRNA